MDKIIRQPKRIRWVEELQIVDRRGLLPSLPSGKISRVAWGTRTGFTECSAAAVLCWVTRQMTFFWVKLSVVSHIGPRGKYSLLNAICECLYLMTNRPRDSIGVQPSAGCSLLELGTFIAVKLIVTTATRVIILTAECVLCSEPCWGHLGLLAFDAC